MIPIEYLWLVLFLVFGVVGMVRGLWKELGVTTILLLSLFALKLGWDQVGTKIVDVVPGGATDETVMAAYFAVSMLFVAFIAYEGVSLEFPLKSMRGIAKAMLGLPGGLLNGYLIVGTIWDVIDQAKYFGIEVTYGTTGASIAINSSLTNLHNTMVQYLPVTFINQFVLLILGVIFLLIIVLK